jgi:hypothetical protein
MSLGRRGYQGWALLYLSRLICLVCVAVCLCLPWSAVAKPSDPNGIKLGTARLHPYLHLDSHFMFNAERAPSTPLLIDGVQTSPPVNDLFFAPVVGGELSWKNTTSTFDLKTEVSWRQYMGLESNRTTGQSGLALKLDAKGGIFQGGSFPLTLQETLERLEDPGILTSAPLRHIKNTAGFHLAAKPGGGALAITSGYDLVYDYYDRSNSGGQCAELLDNLNHRAQLDVALAFLPKTQVTLGIGGSATTYPNGASTSDTCASANTTTMLVDARLGLKSALTAKLSAKIDVGYGDSFPDSVGNLRTVVTSARLIYLLGPQSRLSLGFDRSPSATPYYQVQISNRSTLSYDQRIGDRIQVGANAIVDVVQYGSPGSTVVQANSSTNLPTTRTDISFSAQLKFSYFITPWLDVGLVNKLDGRQAPDYPLGQYIANDLMLQIGAKY